MDTNDQLHSEKKLILKKISRIDSMRKGTINEQVIKTKKKDGSVKENGPYYILTSKDSNGKTLTESIPADKLGFYQQEIENYKEYKTLTEKYEALSVESSKIIGSDENLLAEKLKKNKKSNLSNS